MDLDDSVASRDDKHKELAIAGETLQKAVDYRADGCNELYLEIPNGVYAFRALLHCRFLVRVACKRLADWGEGVPFLECAVRWPPDAKTLGSTHKEPLLIEGFKARCTDGPIGGISFEYDEAESRTRFFIKKKDPTLAARVEREQVSEPPKKCTDYWTVELTFDCPVAVTTLGPAQRRLRDRHPYTRRGLSLDISFPKSNGVDAPLSANRTILFLSYPKGQSYCLRKDNSVYHGQAMDLGAKRQRKATFFENTHTIRTRCAFGSVDTGELASPVLPAVRVGLSLLTIGVALNYYSLYIKEHSEGSHPPAIIPPLVAVAITPLFTDIFFRKRLLSPSAMTTHARLDSIVTTVSLAIYLGALVAIAYLIIHPDHEEMRLASYVTGWLGAVLVIFVAGAGFLILSGGLLRGYACDWCEGWIRIRNKWGKCLGGGACEEERTRRAICHNCHKLVELLNHTDNSRDRVLTLREDLLRRGGWTDDVGMVAAAAAVDALTTGRAARGGHQERLRQR